MQLNEEYKIIIDKLKSDQQINESKYLEDDKNVCTYYENKKI